MKLTAEQKRALDACWLRALAHIKRFGDRSYPRLMDDLRELTRYSPSLSTFRWSRSRISKLKKQAGLKMKVQTIRTEAQEKRLVKWIREIRSRRICNTYQNQRFCVRYPFTENIENRSKSMIFHRVPPY